MKLVNEIDAAWVSGFYEGEGNITFGKNGGIQIYINQTDTQPLEKVKTIFGGRIYGPKTVGSNKPVWTWYLGKFDEVNSFVWKIAPWLSDRRLSQALNKIEHKISMRDIKDEWCTNGHLRKDNLFISSGKRRCRSCVSNYKIRIKEYGELTDGQ